MTIYIERGKGLTDIEVSQVSEAISIIMGDKRLWLDKVTARSLAMVLIGITQDSVRLKEER